MNNNYSMNFSKIINMLTYVDKDIWAIDYTEPYYLEDVLSINDPSFSNVLKYLSKQQGLTTKRFKIKNNTGGYAFNIKADYKNYLAYNFDAPDGPCIVLWTSPIDGLRSMSLVNPEILFSRFLWRTRISQKKMLNTLLAPYTCTSGVNEAGIAIVGIPSYDGVVKQRTGKKAITPYIAIRAILDKCTTIEEARDFLRSHDMNETNHLNYNYQIIDKDGKSIIVSYSNNNMTIIENTDSEEEFKSISSYQDEKKHKVIEMLLNNRENPISINDIMKTLSVISLKSPGGIYLNVPMTLWSGVYYCNYQSLSLCYKAHYDILYQFNVNNPGEFNKYNISLGNQIVNNFDMTSNDRSVILKANNVSKSFGTGGGRVDAVKNISLKIMRGELLVIIGNSGSGKTTLLNILGGMARPDSGKVFVDGNDISDFDDERLALYRKDNIGFIFQTFNLINELTAEENVLLSLENDDRDRAVELLDIVGLKSKKDLYPSNLSGGEQQRISIARAIAKNPKILFCDEPTGSLDYNTGKSILKELERMCRENGKTIVVVTHTREIGKMANRIIYMKNGQIDSVVTNPNPISAEEIEW